MTTETTETRETQEREGQGSRWLWGLLPLLLLAIVVFAFVRVDPLSGLRQSFPPVEELTVQRAALSTNPRQITLTVTNGGPDPVTVAQVLVDEAYWQHTITPSRQIPRLGSATITIQYPWVDEEAHEVVLITDTGVTFEHEIEVAVETPRASDSLGLLTLVGIFVGVIPVAIGLLWYPFVRRLDNRWVNFFLALTAGLLVFLAVDALDEAFEVAERVPGAFQGVGLITIGVITALAVLYGVDGWMRQRHGGELTPLFVSMLIALGIGLHNLGEGLAIGAAYGLGEVGLTAFLILGFTLHNVTEGLGIVAPLARVKPKLWHFVALGALAGVPTIFGAWIGGLAYSPSASVLFLSIGAGAIVQVVWEIGRLMRRDAKSLALPLNAAGFVLGLLVMYVTGIFVAA